MYEQPKYDQVDALLTIYWYDEVEVDDLVEIIVRDDEVEVDELLC